MRFAWGARLAHCRHVGLQSRPRADQEDAWLVRIAVGHIERVVTIEHGGRRRGRVSEALWFVLFGWRP